jgi:enoyl-CoA hydratase/carnithine racemase
LCTLTINRPEKRNALDAQFFEELDAALAVLERESSNIGCVILRGAGEAFSAGADLSEAGGNTLPPCFKPAVIERLANLPQPVVAAVRGVCYTGGLELALACDFILADSTARFADTHGKWGFVGAWGMSQRLPRRVGIPTAKRMMMTSCTLDAGQAHLLGLVDLLATEEELDRLLAEFTAAVLGNSWHTNYAAKRLLRETDGMPLAQGLAHEHYRNPGSAPDSAQRIARFTGK